MAIPEESRQDTQVPRISLRKRKEETGAGGEWLRASLVTCILLNLPFDLGVLEDAVT